MDLTEYAILDSTSLEVQRNLSLKSLPFAISAVAQEEGKGRRGKGWSSPEGNMYVSLALEGPLDVTERSMTPLKVACLVASWLYESTGIRLTIKWPNDLCFGTRKLAGILCESTWNGRNWGPMIIGVGINVHAPPPPGQTPYPAVGLGSLLPNPGSCQELIRSLLNYWDRYWRTLSVQKTLDLCRRFGPGPGHYWQKQGRGNFYESVEIKNDGGLIVKPVSGGESVLLSSATHGFTWFYQHVVSAPLLLAFVEARSFSLICYSDRSQDVPAVVSGSSVGELSEEVVAFVTKKLSPEELASGFPVFCAVETPGTCSGFESALVKAGVRACRLPQRPVLLKTSGGGVKLAWRDFAALEGWLGPARLERASGGVSALLAIVERKGDEALISFLGDSGIMVGPLPLRDFPLSGFSLVSRIYFSTREGKALMKRVSSSEGNPLVVSTESADIRKLCLSLTDGDSSSISVCFSRESGESLSWAGLKAIALGGTLSP